MRKISQILFYVFFISFIFSQCNVNKDAEIPIPEITSLSPDSRVKNTPSFLLTIHGNGFVENSKLHFNDGTELGTNFVNSNEVNVIIDSSFTVPVQNGSIANFTIKIINPDLENKVSNSVTFNLNGIFSFIEPFDVIPNTSNKYTNPALAVGINPGEIYLCYNKYDPDTEIYSVSFIESSDYGDSWTEPVDFLEFTGYGVACDPSMAVGPNGDIFVTFVPSLIPPKLYFIHRKKGESQWSELKVLSDDVSNFSNAIYVDSNNYISIIYAYDPTNHRRSPELAYIGSSGDNINFSPEVNIFPNKQFYGKYKYSSVGSDGKGNIYVAWTADYFPNGIGDRVLFNSSNDGGLNWKSKEIIYENSFLSDIAIDRSGNPVMFIINNNYNMNIYRSEDKGLSFNKIKDESEGIYLRISIDPKMGNYYLLYEDYNLGSWLVFKRILDNNGALDWSIGDPISYDFRGFPDQVVDKMGNVFIIYPMSDGRLLFRRNKNIMLSID